jgi:3-hydroxyisobutyrate dehydrogenase-like beta-hydroxyacid dehydrogenase
VAARLLQSGFAVTGYDTRPEQVEALAPLGLQAAASLAETAADAEAIFTVLPSVVITQLEHMAGLRRSPSKGDSNAPLY